MKIIIDIPERDYNDILNGETKASALNWSIFNAIRDGEPLPKGHGDLIDRKWLTNQIRGKTHFLDLILDAPTIIEAVKAESEE